VDESAEEEMELDKTIKGKNFYVQGFSNIKHTTTRDIKVQEQSVMGSALPRSNRRGL